MKASLLATIILVFSLNNVLLSQTINTVIGSGIVGYGGDGGPATNAQLHITSSVCVSNAGDIYISDLIDHVIRKVDGNTGIISTIAGIYQGYSDYLAAGYSEDGGLAVNARLAYPSGLCVDSMGNVYFVDVGSPSYVNGSTPTGPDYSRCRIRKIDAISGIITTIAGTGPIGCSGDGGLAINAQISAASPCLDKNGNLYFINGVCNSQSRNFKIRKIAYTTGIISTIAGVDSIGSLEDGVPAMESLLKLGGTYSLAVDSIGNLYFSTGQTYVSGTIGIWGNKIRKINAATGIISTIAGNGLAGYANDGSLASNSSLPQYFNSASDIQGNIYISDNANNRIRKIDAATGTITTIAGTGVSGFSGDGGPAIAAQLSHLSAIAVDHSNNIYFSDGLQANRIRKIYNDSLFCNYSYDMNNMVVNFYRGNNNCSNFMWDFGNGNTSNINPNPIVTYQTPGTYSICFKCISPVNCLSCETIELPGNGSGGTSDIIDNQANSSFAIYPNPSSGILHISNIPHGSRIKLINTLGQVLVNMAAADAQTTLDVSRYANGLYTIILEDDGGIITRKILLEK